MLGSTHVRALVYTGIQYIAHPRYANILQNRQCQQLHGMTIHRGVLCEGRGKLFLHYISIFPVCDGHKSM